MSVSAPRRPQREASEPTEALGPTIATDAQAQAATADALVRTPGVLAAVLGSGTPSPEPGGRLKRADEIFALILKIVTILALSFGLLEYDRQKSDGRVTQSLALVEQWENGGFSQTYANINDQIWPLYAQNAPVIATLGEAPQARDLVYANIGEAMTGRDDAFVSEADRSVDKIFQFFERAALCADQTICDYGVLRTFFGDEAESFWRYFSSYAERRRLAGYAGYGEWARKFAAGEIRRPKFLGLF